MTKADIVAEIAGKTGIEKAAVLSTVEEFMMTVSTSLEEGNKKLPWESEAYKKEKPIT